MMASIISGARPKAAQAAGDGGILPSPADAACACPALGLSRDPDSFGLTPSTAHRCYIERLKQADAGSRGNDDDLDGGRIPLGHQQSFCLTAQHESCLAWQTGKVQAAPGSPVNFRSGVPTGGLDQLRTVFPGRGLSPAIILRLGLAASLLVALGAGAVWFRGERASSGPAHSTAPAAHAAAPVVPAAPAAPAAVPAASSASGSLPLFSDAAKAIQQALSAPGPRSYTVQPGEGLSAVAQKFGVSVAALAQANGLAPTQGLQIGQVLVVPAP